MTSSTTDTTTAHSRLLPYRCVHICGIGGAGASALARIMLGMGIRVSGTDRVRTTITDELTALGAQVSLHEAADCVPADCDLLIYSAAVREDNPVRQAASARQIPQRKYADVLGELSALKHTIAIAGTHGKTTTTMLTAGLLRYAGLHPSWVVGGVPAGLPAASMWDIGKPFVVEACEYDRSFLRLHPRIVVINNIEPDHMDYFGSFDNLVGAFHELVSHLPAKGVLIYNSACKAACQVAAEARVRSVSFGVERSAVVSAANLRSSGITTRFDLSIDGRASTTLEVALPGRVNVENTLAALTVARELGVEPASLLPALTGPIGVARRFQQVALLPGDIPVIDDYAHHPTAVHHLVTTARQVFPKRRLRVVFQAHQYARLLNFFREFRDALRAADEVIVCNTYAAREQDVVIGEPEQRLVASLREGGVDAHYAASFADALTMLHEGSKSGDVIFTVGAGDVTDIAASLRDSQSMFAAPADTSRACESSPCAA